MLFSHRLQGCLLTVFLTLTLSFLYPWFSVEAATILKVKGRKVLIDREGGRFKKGQVLRIVSKNGRKRGSLRITKLTKKGRAVGRILKGKARRGWKLKGKKLRGSGRGEQQGTMSQSGPDRDKNVSHAKNHWGFLAGMGMHSMSAKQYPVGTPTKMASMSGTGFTLKGLWDYKISNMMELRTLTGLQQLQASSEDSFCGINNNEMCEVSISYFSVDIWGRFVFSYSFRPWVGMGINLLYPLSHDSSAIDKDSISSTSAMVFGGGMEWNLGGMTIPIQIQYDIYPSSEDVSASSIVVKAGILFPF